MIDATTKEMYEVYLQTRSMRDTAMVFGCDKRTLRIRFTNSGLPLTIPNEPDIQYNGRTYTLTNVFYRATTKPKTMLHYDIWEHKYGPLEVGEHIYFIDKDISNFDLLNLAKVPRILRSRPFTPTPNAS